MARHPVLHSAEWLSDAVLGEDWRAEFKKAAVLIDQETGLRVL